MAELPPDLLAARSKWFRENALNGGSFMRRMTHDELRDPPLIIPVEVMFLLLILTGLERRN